MNPEISPIEKKFHLAIKLFNLAKTLYEKQQYNEAIQLLQRARKINPKYNKNLKDQQILYLLFNSYFNVNDKSNAEKYRNQFARSMKNKEYTSFQSALTHLKSYLTTNEPHFLQKATQNFKSALIEDSKDPDAYYYLGYCYIQRNLIDEAKKHFKMTLLLDRNYMNTHEIEEFEQLQDSISQE